MCLLIAKPAGVDLPDNLDEVCSEAAEANNDGFGFAVGDIVYKRPNISPRKFAHVLRRKVKKEDNAIIHFRYSTSGKNDRDNCHPFTLNDGTIFAHNGVISDKYKPNNGKSDTATLAGTSLNVTDLFWRCKELAGPSNKFAILSPKKELCIVGEEHGSWYKDGLWYSNDYWRRGNRRWSTSYSYTNYSDYDYYDELPFAGSSSFSLRETENNSELIAELSDLVSRYGYASVKEALALLEPYFVDTID